jgi:DNA-binding NarL/FixJ family response regulator
MRRKPEKLTPRERRIIRRIIAGRTNREIATDLRITHQSVRNALTVLYEKCGVRNRLELAMMASRRRRKQPRT